MRQTRRYILTAIPLFLLLFILLPSPVTTPAPAEAGSTITVSTPAELRQAINDANSETGDFVGADTIHLTADITFSDWNTVANGRNAMSSITSEIIIEGNGYTIQRDPSFTTCGDAPGDVDHDFRLLHVASTGDLTLNHVTLRNGCANGGSLIDGNSGGAIYNRGTLLISHSTLGDNSANSFGGGVSNNDDGTLTISHSLVSDNLSDAYGGGVSNEGSGLLSISDSTLSANAADSGAGIFNWEATISLSNSTLSGNVAVWDGGGLANWGTVSSLNSTFSGNAAGFFGGGIYNEDSISSLASNTFADNSAGQAGGAIYNWGSTDSVTSTLLASSGGGNCAGEPFLAASYTLSDDDTCGLSGTGNQQNAAAGLLPLADNGGPTLTRALMSNSGALDAGSCAVGSDQRGETRPVDLSNYANADNGCDIGAVEMQQIPVTVTTAAELIQAINDANSEIGDYVGLDTIELKADITLTATHNTINGRNGLPSITSDIIIEGNGYAIQRDLAFTCSGLPGSAVRDFRLLHIGTAASSVVLNNVMLRNGCANANSEEGGWGGGILNMGTIDSIANTTICGNSAIQEGGGIFNFGLITSITGSIISDNSAVVAGGGINNRVFLRNLTATVISGNTTEGDGGGIHNSGVLTRSADLTISDNSAEYFGGGIGNWGPIDSLANTTISGNWAGIGGGIFNEDRINRLANATISGNTAVLSGGGISNLGRMESVLNSTFSGNSSGYEGGGLHNSGSITSLTNTILANSPSGGNCAGVPVYPANYILSDDDTCRPVGIGNRHHIEDGLLPLADNGGPTLTHALGPHSEALDAGSCEAGTDQRGAARLLDLPGYPNMDNGCDVGAVEMRMEELYEAPTVLAVRTFCDEIEVDYLARNAALAADIEVAVYRERPGGADELVASENLPASGDGERYRVALPFGRVYPAGTAFYVRIARVDAVLTTPPQPCTP